MIANRTARTFRPSGNERVLRISLETSSLLFCSLLLHSPFASKYNFECDDFPLTRIL